AVYLAERGIGGWKVLAVATSGGRADQTWRPYANPQVGASAPAQLTGRRLALASAGSSRGTAFLENGPLDRRVHGGGVVRHRETAPDVASAVTTVSLGKADAVFAPEGHAKGLRPVGDALARVPLPAFALVKPGLPPAVVSAITTAVLGFAGPTLDGWKASG